MSNRPYYVANCIRLFICSFTDLYLIILIQQCYYYQSVYLYKIFLSIQYYIYDFTYDQLSFV